LLKFKSGLVSIRQILNTVKYAKSKHIIYLIEKSDLNLTWN